MSNPLKKLSGLSMRPLPLWAQRLFTTRSHIENKFRITLPTDAPAFDVRLGKASACTGELIVHNDTAFTVELDRLVGDLKLGFTFIDIISLHRVSIAAHSSHVVKIRTQLTEAQKFAINAYGLSDVESEMTISVYLNALRWHLATSKTQCSTKLCAVHQRKPAIASDSDRNKPASAFNNGIALTDGTTVGSTAKPIH